MIAFGPVPSRRLGQSLGINNLAGDAHARKACTYNCAYCQAGNTLEKTWERRRFRSPVEVVTAVCNRVAELRAAGESIDYLSFVPDGEPTLDLGLGAMIRSLRPLGIPVAVITSGALLWRDDVRAELAAADLVSVKVDAVDARTWQRLDRPAPGLPLSQVLRGVRRFAASYRGVLATETMLVRGVNDDPTHVRRVASFVAELAPQRAYLLVPTRPPAEADVLPPDDAALAKAEAAFIACVPTAECLAKHESRAFGATGHFEEDVLAAVAVHPMRATAVLDLARRAGAGPLDVERLVTDGRLTPRRYRGELFFTRGTA
jgi:wyosine [tRNA(Phe)-imidazoG37] synthetase (radical SAM superfamily)